MNKIQLKPKQLAILQEIQTQKAQLQKVFQELVGKETLVAELIFEENNVVGTVTSMKLDNGFLEYEIEGTKPAKVKKAKMEVNKVKE